MTTSSSLITSTNTSHLLDDDANQRSVIDDKIQDATTPGAQIEFTPDEAQYAGAFSEDAITEQDAITSQIDAPALMLNNEGGAS